MIDAKEIDPKAVARRMRTQMQVHDIQVPQLARATALSQGQLVEMTSGRTTISPMLAKLIAQSLRCTADYLLTGTVRP